MRMQHTKKLVTLAMLSALAYAAVFSFRIPVILFLKYEPKDVVLAIGGFLYGNLGLQWFYPALLLTVPMSYMMLICIQFVAFYTFSGKKYFLAEDKIVLPKNNESEDFYDKFDL